MRELTRYKKDKLQIDCLAFADDLVFFLALVEIAIQQLEILK